MSRINQLKSFLQEAPNDSFLNFALAKEYEKMGESDLAEKYYRHILKIEPEYIGMYYHLGKLLFNDHRLKEAHEIYTQGMNQAKQQNDQHALSELAGARLEIDEDEI